MHRDQRGYEMTTDSAAAAAALDTAIDNFLHWRSALMPEIQSALEADPDFGLAQAINGLVLHAARNASYRPNILASLDKARAAEAGMTAREKLYVAALEAAAQGEIARSVSAYEAILASHPTDLFALRLAQMELFWIGEMAWSADISSRADPAWTGDVPGYGDYLSCRAFDLEETHRYEEAEWHGRRAVDLDPTDVWGTHAVAHVLIMQGRHEEGIAWLEGLKDNWADANQMSLHLWWHRCLFHLERGETEAALEIHDSWVRNREHPLLKALPDLYIDLQNGASLLLRLELCGIDVGNRWEELAEQTLARLEDHTSPFTSAHFAIILAATGRFAEAETLLASMRAFAAEDAGTLGPRTRAAALPAAEAALAHRRGAHQKVVDLLLPSRRLLWQMGGSDAQRDLFFLILADSIKNLGRKDLLGIVLADIAAAGFTHPAGRVGYRDTPAPTA